MMFKKLYEKIRGGAGAAESKAELEYVSWNKPGPFVDITYAVQWKHEDGSLRIPEEPAPAEYPVESFTLAGQHYSSLKQLMAQQPGEAEIFCDIYGNAVFTHRERFPCFDSYDYLYEHRYFRWFYVRCGNSLSCVYYQDEKNTLQVTEDVRTIRRGAWEKMQKINWQG